MPNRRRLFSHGNDKKRERERRFSEREEDTKKKEKKTQHNKNRFKANGEGKPLTEEEITRCNNHTKDTKGK